MSVGEITHAEVVTGEPVIVDGTQTRLKQLVLTDADGRQWEKNIWLAVCDESEQRSTSREKACVLEPLFTATPTQLEEFEQDDVEIRWPELGVVCPKTEPFWFFNFNLIKTKQEGEEWETIWIQMEIDGIKKKLRIYDVMTVKTKDDAEEEIDLRDKLAELQKRLAEFTSTQTEPTAPVRAIHSHLRSQTCF